MWLDCFNHVTPERFSSVFLLCWGRTVLIANWQRKNRAALVWVGGDTIRSLSIAEVNTEKHHQMIDVDKQQKPHGGMGVNSTHKRFEYFTYFSHEIKKKVVSTLAPIWFPHWPACRCTISLILSNWKVFGNGGVPVVRSRQSAATEETTGSRRVARREREPRPVNPIGQNTRQSNCSGIWLDRQGWMQVLINWVTRRRRCRVETHHRHPVYTFFREPDTQHSLFSLILFKPQASLH